MNSCAKLAAAVALVLPAYGQLIAEPDRAAELRQIFDAAPAVSTLRCEIAPMGASLNYGFQFQAVYRIQIPLIQFSTTVHSIQTYTRVTPENGQPVYLTKNEVLPANRGGTDAETVGAFILGEGSYRTDVLIEDDMNRTCRATWQVQARRNGSERQLRLANAPGEIEELTLNGTPVGDARPGPRIARLTILINAAPLNPKATELSPDDVQKSLDTVTSILREMPAQTVRLIAFNLDQRAIIYRSDEYDAENTAELAGALAKLDFSVLDYKAIRDRMQPPELLVSIVQAELGAPQAPDAMLVIGPRTLLQTPLPPDALAKRPNSVTPVFSLQFQGDRPMPRMPRTPPDMDPAAPRMPRTADGGILQRVISEPADLVEKVVARIKGQTFAIRTPHDLADAIQRMDSKIARTAPAAPPPSADAPAPHPPAPHPPAPPKPRNPATVLPPTAMERVIVETTEPTGDEDPVDVLVRLRDRVLAHAARIPNHTCVENVQRDNFDLTARRPGESCDAILGARKQRDFFQRLTLSSTDWLRLDVAFMPGREMYSWAGATRFEDGDIDELVPEGAFGTGPFTSMLLGMFSQRDPRHIFEGETKVDDRRVFEYSFRVTREQSRYRVKAHKEWVITGFSGSLMVDPKTADLVRLIVRTDELPPETDTCETDTTMEYDVVQLSGGDYLLPKSARQRFIGREGFEAENTIEFSACRDFQAESKVAFDPAAVAERSSSTMAALPAIAPGLPVAIELTSTVRFGTAAAGDRIDGRLTKPILDTSNKVVAPAGTPVQGRLMRVELRHVPREERTVALRWETIRMGAAAAPLNLAPARKSSPIADGRGGLRRRGMEIVLPLPSETKYAVMTLSGMSLESGTQTEWVTGKP